jgi:hypothetical protein
VLLDRLVIPAEPFDIASIRAAGSFAPVSTSRPSA